MRTKALHVVGSLHDVIALLRWRLRDVAGGT